MKRAIYIGLGIALLLAILSPLASSSPDGLERVAEDHGFIGTAAEAPFQIIPDYVLPWVDNEALGTIGAGIVGTLITFVAVSFVARILARRQAS